MSSHTKLIALTGPSAFTPDCIRMIEEGLQANFVLLYQNRMEHVEQWLANCDGLVLAGGVDIHPSVYGQNVQAGMGLTKFDYARDLKELLVIDYCFKHKKPILGICRGHQIMSIYKGLGDDFIMDLDSRYIHQPGKYNLNLQKNEVAHSIDLLEPGTFMVKQAGERKPLTVIQKKVDDGPKAWVNSWHHQGVKYAKQKKQEYLKKNMKILGIAPSGDEENTPIIEMMCGTGPDAFWLTAQFHPESDFEDNTCSRQVIEMFASMLSNPKKE